MSNFKNLLVWQKAIELTVDVYSLTKSFPKEEMYGLVSQIRRCAVSVPSNIAEGQARKYHQQFAQGSLAELETQMIISKKLGYIVDELSELLEKIHSIGKMFTKLKQNITNDQ